MTAVVIKTYQYIWYELGGRIEELIEATNCLKELHGDPGVSVMTHITAHQLKQQEHDQLEDQITGFNFNNFLN